jgi:uncharacterized protein (DUF697 family)
MEATATAVATNEVLQPGEQADKVIRNYALGSIVPSLIPVPMLDLVVVTGIQLKMLHSLAQTYGVEFKEEAGRSAVAALIGGTASLGVSRLVTSAVKAVPFVGQITGAVTMPVINGGSTYAIGKVFKQHFESGGTFLTFDASKVRAYFEEQLKEGKQVVAAAQAATGEKDAAKAKA